MAYTRTQWVEQETPLSAQNMNNIEDGIEELQSTKVDKVSGKGLSDQNYTATEKTKLAGIAEGAEVNVQSDWNQTNTSADDYIKNKPGSASSSAAGLMSATDKSKLDGVQAGAEVNQNAFAVVSIESGSATALRATSKQDTVSFIAGNNVTMNASGKSVTIDAKDTTYTPATTSANGLMSAADKTKLNNIEAGAQVNRTYTAVTGKPQAALSPGFGGTVIVSQVSQNTNGQVSVTDREITMPNSDASTSAHGLMSAADKTKLNNLPTMRRVNAKLDTAVTVGARKTAKLSFSFTASGLGSYNSALLMDIIDMPSGIAINSISFSSFTLVLHVVNATTENVRIPEGTNAHVLLLQGV